MVPCTSPTKRQASLGANGVVGAGIPLAAGAALSAKLRGTQQVAVSFFGDGATNQGVFHETLNLAAVWELPVVFVCENNRFGMGTPQHEHQRVEDIAVRAPSYDIPGVTVDGNDVLKVYALQQMKPLNVPATVVVQRFSTAIPTDSAGITSAIRGHPTATVKKFKSKSGNAILSEGLPKSSRKKRV